MLLFRNDIPRITSYEGLKSLTTWAVISYFLLTMSRFRLTWPQTFKSDPWAAINSMFEWLISLFNSKAAFSDIRSAWLPQSIKILRFFPPSEHPSIITKSLFGVWLPVLILLISLNFLTFLNLFNLLLPLSRCWLWQLSTPFLTNSALGRI